MRTIIASNLVSLDGYAIGPGGDLLALPFDASFDEYNLQLVRRCDALLAGRTTYLQLAGYWLPVADQPDVSPLAREISLFQRHAQKYVVSDSLTRADVLSEPTTILPRAEAADALRELKETEGGDIVMFGSLTTLNALLPTGVVDEVHVNVGSAATGGGTPLFGSATPRLRLVDTWRGEESDNIVLRYATS